VGGCEPPRKADAAGGFGEVERHADEPADVTRVVFRETRREGGVNLSFHAALGL
jgi:hypothetical protein